MFHAFILLSEKNKYKKEMVGTVIQNWHFDFTTYFLTEINVFVVTQWVKYQKKVPLGTGTEFQVPIPVQIWTVPNPNSNELKFSKHLINCIMMS